MPIRAIAYISQAAQPWQREAIDAMIEDAAAFNVRAGVTGVLLFDGVQFLQYIEGPATGIDEAYGRILASTKHSEVVELGRGPIGHRLLPYWAMQWLLADPAQLRTAARANWTGFVSSPGPVPVTAMDHLQLYLGSFVSRWPR